MNQQCKVCGEPAAGFHFGAFTCEGCKSFFGRSYNNLSSISECKNNGGCVINKKNRTSCKACRLRKCLMVGMSKSGSRYGRRSNWFKIHCLLQEQQQQSQQHQQKQHKNSTWDSHPGMGVVNHPDPRIHQFLSQQHAMGRPTTKEDLIFMGLDEYKNSTSPSISSPESHNSDSSVEVSDARLRANFFRPPESKDMFLPFASLPVFPPPFSFPPMFPPNYLYKPTPMLATTTNNNNIESVDVYSKRFFLDAVLQSQRSPLVKEEHDDDTETEDEPSRDQENPMDLSMKNCLIQERTSLSEESDEMTDIDDVAVDNEDDDDSDVVRDEIPEVRSAPMDLSVSLKC